MVTSQEKTKIKGKHGHIKKGLVYTKTLRLEYLYLMHKERKRLIKNMRK
ncbi:hypothetical protein QUC31_019556 [Theobroma cacao]